MQVRTSVSIVLITSFVYICEQIYFQSMQTDDLNESDHGGEIEIERFPVRMLEARSKDLVPVFDYLQNPKFQLGRYVSSYKNLWQNKFYYKNPCGKFIVFHDNSC